MARRGHGHGPSCGGPAVDPVVKKFTCTAYGTRRPRQRVADRRCDEMMGILAPFPSLTLSSSTRVTQLELQIQTVGKFHAMQHTTS